MTFRKTVQQSTFDNGILLKNIFNIFLYDIVSNKSLEFITDNADLLSCINTTFDDARWRWNGIDNLITVLFECGLDHIGHHLDVQQFALVAQHALEFHIHSDVQIGTTQSIKKNFLSPDSFK